MVVVVMSKIDLLPTKYGDMEISIFSSIHSVRLMMAGWCGGTFKACTVFTVFYLKNVFLLLPAATPLLMWAAGRSGYLNTISRPIGSDKRCLSVIIMSQCTKDPPPICRLV